MDALSALWQLGILASVLIFGVKLGLASGLARLSKRNLAFLCIGYGGGILILAEISSFYSESITSLITSYYSLFFLLMALIMIFAGIYTIREFKLAERDTMKTTRAILIAPCPCYFGSILASILMAAPTVGLGTFALSQYVAVAMVLVILVSYYASDRIVRYIKRPYPIILGNFMLFLGIYFLLSSLLIPNIINSFSKSMRGMTIPSMSSLIMAFVIAIVIIALGYLISKKNDFLIKF